jgi:hypothetical protein
MAIKGIDQDAPTVANERGGKQSHLPYRFDLLEPQALFRVAEILASGADKYGEWNWLELSVEEILNHAIAHIYAYLAGDHQDDHLGHAACRLHMALAIHLGKETGNEEE